MTQLVLNNRTIMVTEKQYFTQIMDNTQTYLRLQKRH